MNPIVERETRQTVMRLNARKFVQDPLWGAEKSLENSRQSSAQKRHGRLIELTVRTELASLSHYQVWTTNNFRVPSDAEHIATLWRNGAIGTVPEIAYTGEGKRRQIDIAAYDRSRRRLSALEIKRANYRPDAGKMRGILGELIATQAVLPGFGRYHGLDPAEVHARVVCFYGARSAPAPWSLTAPEFDIYVEHDVSAAVSEMTDLFRELIDGGSPDDQFPLNLGGPDA